MDHDPGLAYLHLFDAILIAALVHYYFKLGYAYLKYGAIAFSVSLVANLLTHFSVITAHTSFGIMLGAMLSTIFAVLLSYCVLDLIVRYEWQARVAAMAGAGFFLAVSAVWLLGPSPVWQQVLLMAVPTLITGIAAMLLLLKAADRSFGLLWFSGLLVLTAVCMMGPIFLSGTHEVCHLVGLVTAVSLLMMMSERAIIDLDERERRIEGYLQDRRRMELQFSQAQKLESLGVLAGGIAHDFNNMLTSILGFASMAMQKLSTDSELREDLYMIMSGARQAVDLTSQMLTYAGKGATRFESVSLSELVANHSSLMTSIIPAHVSFEQQLKEDLPSLKGDKAQLGQVVMNLIANAVDAIGEQEGSIELSTGLTQVDEVMLLEALFAEDREPGAYLYLSVRDSGIGMNAEQVERIFDPFYSEKQSGKGLGLSSLSGIVRKHKGFIRVWSAPGEGTEFTIYFPVLSVIDQDPGRSEVREPDPRAEGRVLLADDDARIRSLMASILESDHLKPVSTEDGREALAAYRSHNGDFDLLVLDCTMPKMTGTELYHQLRSEGVKTPIVLVSGYQQDQVAKNIEQDPNGSFIKKPFTVDDFLAEIRRVTGKAVA